MNYNKYNKISKKYIQKYKNKIDKIKYRYKKAIKTIDNKSFMKLCKKHRKLTIKIIKKISKEFFKDYKKDIIILTSGSLARHSNNLYSDIDLNIFTNNYEFEKIIELEDLIANLLYKIMNFKGRDKIHSMAVYLPLISSKKIDMSNNSYIKTLDNKKIVINCRPNSEQLIFENYNSTRNINNILEYLNKNDTINSLNEWSNCFEIIYSKGKLKKLYNNQRKKCNDITNLTIFIDNLISKINKDDKIILHNRIKNSDLKEIVKTNTLFNTYAMLAIVYRYEKKIKKFNLDEFYSKSSIISKEEIEKIFNHLKNVQNLQIILDSNKIDLTSHSNKVIDINKINKQYKKMFNKNNIINDLILSKKELYDMIKKILNKIRRDLYEQK